MNRFGAFSSNFYQQKFMLSLKKIHFVFKCPVLLVFLILSAVLISCRQEQNPDSTAIIVAKVGDKIITKADFIRRAEYTLRPNYCKSDSYIHRKIVLNSLIAEKLLALEAGDSNGLSQSGEFQLYIQGRKEQAMRQYHYYREAVSKVALTPEEVQKVANSVGRTYRVAYFSIKNDSLAGIINNELQRNAFTFEQIYKSIGGKGRIPEREISWENYEHETILNALYSEQLQVNQVLGPLKIDANNFIVLKVQKWIDRPPISEAQLQQRLSDVKEYLISQKAWASYRNYVAQLMRGKRVEFNKPVFAKLLEVVGPVYMASAAEKEAAFNQNFWHNSTKEKIISHFGNELDEIKPMPLLTIDGEIWTVGDLETELKRHPLVFRKKESGKSSFTRQLKLAIVDVIRDRYITQDAYKKGYDKVEAVRLNAEMWKDNILSLYQKYQYLKSIDCKETDQLKTVENYLNPYVDELQNKYHHVIEINTGLFDTIKLTHIDMAVIQPEMPFPLVVPAFPQLTTDYKLDYGRKKS